MALVEPPILFHLPRLTIMITDMYGVPFSEGVTGDNQDE